MQTPGAIIGDLRNALKWAMDKVVERGDCAAGIFCIHCGAGVKKEDYKGLVTDKIIHKANCPWVAANKLCE